MVIYQLLDQIEFVKSSYQMTYRQIRLSKWVMRIEKEKAPDYPGPSSYYISIINGQMG